MSMHRPLARHSILLGLLLTSASFAQTATPTTPTSTPALPASSTTTPTRPAAAPSAATNRTVSALAINISQAVKGQLVRCPNTLKVSAQAVCLYAKAPVNSVQSNLQTLIGKQALGPWKSSGQASSVLIQEAGNLAAFVLLTPLSAQESLVVVDAAKAKAPASSKPAVPTGAVKGQPYVLGSDLIGLVNVIDLGGGRYRLNVAGQTALTISAGSRTAQRAGGNVDLPFAPLTDGKNLILPLANLRALGCTVTDNPNGVTIACGSASAGVKPIVF